MNYKNLLFTVFFLLFSLTLFAAEYYQATKQLNIRNGPGKNYSAVGSLSRGDSVLLDTINSGWGQVIVNNKLIGYASLKYLSKHFKKYSSSNSKSVKKRKEKQTPWEKGAVVIVIVCAVIYKCFFNGNNSEPSNSLNETEQNETNNERLNEHTKEPVYISQVLLEGRRYCVYDAKGDRISSKFRSDEDLLLGFSDKLIIIKENRRYLVYNPKFDRISRQFVSSNERFIGITGNTITFEESGRLKTYDENFDLISKRPSY